jgi:hypothetical protein
MFWMGKLQNKNEINCILRQTHTLNENDSIRANFAFHIRMLYTLNTKCTSNQALWRQDTSVSHDNDVMRHVTHLYVSPIVAMGW